ncbi:hypothetical protein A6A03_00530 [Chloroflexus islandicus]|uniref:Uncharacterized protein n=1 Tax=Chloroflexus islandicus TaxID=1707952 RepID=A0A178MFF1_9CHLR|nr:hypothetical protein [Chloroflexus islandicus]OAN47266.1 hypothetical protein A6A03_00530 [Chloroflexus islandicus]
MKGYIYRCAPITAAQLRDLITQQVGLPCWYFSGTHLWQAPALTALERSAQIDVNRDFGHAFSQQAEVRWKQLDSDAFDVLILSERALTIPGARTLASAWEVREHPQRPLIQSGKRQQLVYYTYHAPNGAAQFTRYIAGEIK